MKYGNTISLVIPCKNEERALKSVLEYIPNIIDEIIVVDNNSNDKTQKVAKSFGARVFTESREKNGIGYGYALQKGISEAKGNIIICMDGDGSYPIQEVPGIINYLIKKDLDFISCNRLPFKFPKRMSAIRAFGVRILNLFIKILFGYKIKDSLTGMWVFRNHALNDFKLTEGGWNFSLEIKLKGLMGSKFEEYQISYKDRVLDLSKQNLLITGITHLLFLFKFKGSLLWNSILNFQSSYVKIRS